MTATNHEAAVLSIGFLVNRLEKSVWRNGGGRGTWGACFATLALAFEPDCNERRILESLPAQRNMDLNGCLNAMANLGYIARPAQLALDEIDTRVLPCLFVPDHKDESPLVVLAQRDDVVTIYDSASNTITETKSGNTHGTAYLFQTYDRHAEPTSHFMRSGMNRSWFRAIVQRFSGSAGQILTACLLLNIFALAPALFIMIVYDRVISPADLSALLPLALGVAIALVAEWALRDIRAEGLAWMTARLDNLIGSRIFSQLIGLKPEMIENASVSAQIARVRTFESVRDFFSSAIFLSFIEIPFVAIALFVIWWVAGPLVLLPLAMIGFYGVLFFAMRYKIMTAMRIAAKASSARQQFMIETIDKLPGIRINGLTPAWDRKFSTLSGRESLMTFQLGFLGSVAETLAHALTVTAAVLTIAAGAHLIWAGAMTTGALVACMILVWRVLTPFYSLCTMIPRLEQLRNSIAQINTLMDIHTEKDLSTVNATLSDMQGHIAFNDAVLRYENRNDPAIDGLNIDIAAGGICVVTGRNGAGKTSVLKMIKGLYQPATGMVRIDGFDIRQMAPEPLRRHIAYIPQKPDFFPGTLLENLVIGNPFAPIQTIEDALRRADAWEETKDILHENLDPDILNTTLAARLSIARCYIQDAKIVLIDELPNTVMNGAAGRALRQYIADKQRGRTFVIVSHRGDIMDMADQIIHLAGGRKPRAGARADMIKFIQEAA